MRTLALFLMLACGFGVAAIWQQRRVVRLRAERELAFQLEQGILARTPSGNLGPSEAVVVIGRPAGPAPPRVEGAPASPDLPDASGSVALAAAGTEARPDQTPAGPAPLPVPPLGDFVVEVVAGQSLSKIAHAHYGHAPVALVTKLASYNGLADANALRAGMQLKLPPLERLGVVLER